MKTSSLAAHRATPLVAGLWKFLAVPAPLLLATMAYAQPDYSGCHIWRPPSGCTKYYTSGNGHRFCVVHDMEGYYYTAISYMNRCDISVSVHYACNGKTDSSDNGAPPGELTQMVREAYYAWHATCWNTWSFGCEHEGFASNPAWFTEAMYSASSGLYRHWCDAFSIPKDRNHIIAHGEKSNAAWVSWVRANYPSMNPTCNTHTDPGPYWNWGHFMDLIRGGTDGATYVSQSVANNTVLSPGQGFACTFTMRNSGTTTWIANGGSGYTFNYVSGTDMGAPHINALGGNVGPGGNGSFTLNFTAPGSPGTYSSVWQMNNSAGYFFGAQVTFTIQVRQVNNASVVSISVPSQVTVGAPFSATVTMNNNGSKAWASGGSNPHRLGSQSAQDNTTWGFSRVELPFTPVNPGQNASFTLNCTAPSTTGQYTFAWRMVQEAVEWFGGTASTTINVVPPPPSITTQPASQTMNLGESVTFSVVANNVTSYQWKKNGTAIAGATTSSYTRSNVQMADAGFYSVTCSNSGGGIDSAAAQLIIAQTPYAQGDGTGLQGQYYDNQDFTSLKLTRTDSAVDFDWAAGAPDSSMATDQFSIRWSGQVQPRYSQTYTFYTTSDDGVRLWVNGVLLIDKWQDQSATEWSGSISLTAGQMYNIQMEYFENGGAASARLAWSSASEGKAVIPQSQLYATVAPAITTQPVSQTASTGQNVTFSVVAGGTQPISYQWQLNQANISGATGSSYTVSNAQADDVGLYRVICSNAMGSTASSEAALTLNNGVVFSEDFESGNLNNWGVASGSSGLTISTAQKHGGAYSAALNSSANKMYHNVSPIEGHAKATFWIYDDNGTQTRLFGDIRSYTGGAYNNGGLAQLFAVGRYSVGLGTGTGTLASEVVNTAKYQGRVLAGANTGWFNLNANRATGWHKFEIERLGDGSTIVFYVDGTQDRQISGANYLPWDDVTIGSVGSGTTAGSGWFDDIKLEYFDLPSIAAQPASQTVVNGNSVTFTVAAEGNVTAYQWRYNGANIAGATDSSFTKANLQLVDAGSYSVLVFNKAGFVASAAANLTVLEGAVAPTVTRQPESQTLNQGDTLTLVVQVSGSEPLSYQWRKNGAEIEGASTSIYAQINVQAADAGDYDVIVSNAAGNATSAIAGVTVNLPPSLTAGPASQTVNQGANVLFSVSATGSAPLSYQWRYNGANIAGAIGTSYARSNVQLSDEGSYTVAVSNMAGVIESDPAVLTVNTPPAITQQPVSQTIDTGSAVTFSVTATGSAPLSYQWQLNGANIAGATSASYSISSAQSGNVGNYSVAVANPFGSVSSSEAALKISNAVVFSDNFDAGNLNNWTVAVSPATGLSASTAQHNSGSYAAYLNSSANKMYHNLGIGISGHAKYTFWGYDAIGANSNAGQTRWFGEARSYTGGAYGNGGVQQLFAVGRYTVSFGTGTGILAGETMNSSNYQGRVLAGANTGWFNLSGAAKRSIGWHKFEIEVLTNGTANFYVDGTLGRSIPGVSAFAMDDICIGSLGTGSTAGDVWFDDVKAEYYDAPSISSQPSSQTASAGNNVTFSVSASGTVTGYQWRFNGTNITGGTGATLVLNNCQSDDAGTYSVLVLNGTGPATSANATLAVLAAAPKIKTQPVSQNVAPGASVTFSVVANGTEPIWYQWTYNGSPISGATGTSYTRNNVQSSDAGSYAVVCSNAVGSTNSANAVLTLGSAPVITAQPASQTANLNSSVSFSVAATGSSPLYYQWYFNGSAMPDKTDATLTLDSLLPESAGQYAVIVSNWVGIATSSSASLTVNVPAVITTPPSSQTVAVGGTAIFGAIAGGTSPIYYQWAFNGANIPGATTASYTKANCQAADAGSYSVTCWNMCGTNTSEPAVLTVEIPPSITTQPASQTITQGADVTFGVAATGAAPLAYQWYFNSEPIASATSASYTKSNVQAADAGVYYCVVTNSCGTVTSATATLAVNVPPSITTQPASQSVAKGADVNFSVVVSGDAPLSYQWRLNGVNISGATASSYSRSNVAAVDAGSYSVVVTNNSGSVTSANAVLAVNSPPVLSLGTSRATERVVTFETITDYANDHVMFRKPLNSSTTSAFVESTVTNYSLVSTAFPAGNPNGSGSKVLKASWSFKTGLTNAWMRLNTYNASLIPNPAFTFDGRIRFDIYVDKAIQLALGLRETGGTAAVGGNGGTSGAVEWVGATGKSGGVPICTRTINAGSWTTVEFNLRAESCYSFNAGNGVLDGAQGVLEHLAIVPGGGLGVYTVYLDNFEMITTNTLPATVSMNANAALTFTASATEPDAGQSVTYSLDAGAPAGATINSSTGAFTWTPAASGTSSITVRATDNGTPSQSEAVTFSAVVNNDPLGVQSAESSVRTDAGEPVMLAWPAVPGSSYQVQYQEAGGEWVNYGEPVVADGTESSVVLPNSDQERAYRILELSSPVEDR